MVAVSCLCAHQTDLTSLQALVAKCFIQMLGAAYADMMSSLAKPAWLCTLVTSRDYLFVSCDMHHGSTSAICAFVYPESQMHVELAQGAAAVLLLPQCQGHLHILILQHHTCAHLHKT